MAAYERARAHDLEVVLLEEIPGPDDRLCSYYTYMDENGDPLADFTKRIIRRYPENRGLACYHVTDWNPKVRDLGLRLFHHVGLQGVGNVEFKLDHRDGLLKVIECNARFTAGNPVLAASGYDLALFVYNRLAGVPQPQLKGKKYTEGLHLWFPRQDAHAFLELRAKGRLTLPGWLRSLCHRQVVPFFSWDDPGPFLFETARLLGSAGRAGRRTASGARSWLGRPAPGSGHAVTTVGILYPGEMGVAVARVSPGRAAGSHVRRGRSQRRGRQRSPDVDVMPTLSRRL